jgi:hypothetical protein
MFVLFTKVYVRTEIRQALLKEFWFLEKVRLLYCGRKGGRFGWWGSVISCKERALTPNPARTFFQPEEMAPRLPTTDQADKLPKDITPSRKLAHINITFTIEKKRATMSSASIQLRKSDQLPLKV